MALHLSKREKIIFCLTVLVAAAYLLWTFLIEAQFIEKRATLKKEISRKEENLKRSLGIIEQRSRLEQEFRLFQERARSEVSPEKQVSTFHSELQFMAKAAEVTISSFDPLAEERSRPKDDDFYRKLSAEMKIECNLSALSKFLYGIQTSSRILDVRNMEISPKLRSSQDLRGKILISTIILKEAK